MAHPAYDQCIKASHLFNLLDARGVISVTERQAYIGRVRALAKRCADAFVTRPRRAGGGVNGSIIAIVLVVWPALIAGGAMYYLQVYAFYDRSGADGGTVTLRAVRGRHGQDPVSDFRGIDADSSPDPLPRLLSTADAGRAAIYPNAVPLNAPGLVRLLRRRRHRRDLAAGRAAPVMGEADVPTASTGSLASTPTAAAFAWHQINACGEVVSRATAARGLPARARKAELMPDLLIELFSEEIPARMQAKAAEDLKRW
jgi:hypothetical protein